MIVGVWHAKNPTFNKPFHRFTPANFQLVAKVDAEQIDHVFSLTNHIDKSWTENESVTALIENPRSTSVGDIVVDESGAVWYCASIGWENQSEQETFIEE